MRARRAALAIALAVAVARAAPAAADPPRPMTDEASVHFRRGLEAYQRHDYPRAIDELAAGYAIDPHPDFLFPWAQAERLSGDCKSALPLYRKVLAAGVDADEERDVVRLAAICEEEVGAGEPAEPEPARETAPPEPAPPARAPTSAPVEVAAAAPPAGRSWIRDPWGGVLAVGGVLGVGVGVVSLVAARRAEDDSAGAGSLDDFVDGADRADLRYRVGAVSLAVGAGLLACAVVRYVVVAHDQRDVEVAVGAGQIALAGRF